MNPEGARERIGAIAEAAAATPWPGVAGNTDRLVLRALHHLAQSTGKMTLHADVRTLATQTGYSSSTVSRSLRRLRGARWVSLARKADRATAQAAVYTLQVPRQRCTARTTPISHDAASTEPSSPPVGCTHCTTQIAPPGCLANAPRSTSLPGQAGVNASRGAGRSGMPLLGHVLGQAPRLDLRRRGHARGIVAPKGGHDACRLAIHPRERRWRTSTEPPWGSW